MVCVGEACTSLNRETGLALPLVTGVGLNLRTGEMFPAMFSDKGPDMDLRLARTLTGGEKVSIITITIDNSIGVLMDRLPLSDRH